MNETRTDIMGMPIVVEVLGVPEEAARRALRRVFDYFKSVDERFSTYKSGSEIMRLNRSEIGENERSGEMREIFELADRTRRESGGYFDIRRPDGILDPSGVVKGWAIRNAARILAEEDVEHFYIDAGGDIQTGGRNAADREWSVGIQSPFSAREIVKVLYPRGRGVATSGTYRRGRHIYNPNAAGRPAEGLVSLTVVGPDVCEADRFATSAFAMGKDGVAFIAALPGFEGYAIDEEGRAIMTAGFAAYTAAEK